MDFWVFLLALAGAAALSGLVVHLAGAARLAAAATERDVLRARVVDLEATLAEDTETAAVLRPISETLRRMEGQVGTLERDRMAQFAAVRTALTRVEDETSALGRQTASLAGSLNASSVRGAWGEVQLRRVLEHAGMLARCDFDEQVRATSRHGRGVRPDVVIRLPADRVLVIDAKAPMTAFLQAQGEDVDPRERGRLLGEHARALHGHVTALAAKDYWSAFSVTPEAVLCFVPTEAMLSAALAADPSLHEAAMAKRVVLVGPGGLLAVLRAAEFTWQQDALATGAQDLLDIGRELYDRLATMGQHANAMGASLRRSVESYNRFVGTLESRVLVSARRMTALGVASAAIPGLDPVEATPRVLTAAELIDEVTAGDARAELDLTDGTASRGDAERTASGREAG